ncbi:hypothetical protein AGMMS4952_06320 [Spirochaetia bacterium]|nr:hypothetical protein AGMMS4952_06320 [Spirochaetia bacterium]
MRFNTAPLGAVKLGVWGICSPTYSKISRRNLRYRRACPAVIHFHSRLSAQIDGGVYDIQYLDAQYLAVDLMENESELFAKYVVVRESFLKGVV